MERDSIQRKIVFMVNFWQAKWISTYTHTRVHTYTYTQYDEKYQTGRNKINSG